MLLNQKLVRAFFNISGMLMFVAALLIWANPVMGEEALPTEVVSGVEADAQSAPCKGLKPYNNLDELLYQFYINLDSDCLFKMPVEELENIWDTKIAFYKKGDGSLGYWLSGIGDKLDGKPYISPRNAFYIQAVIGSNHEVEKFYIKRTREYSEKKLSLFIDDDSPRGLPKPLKTKTFRSAPSSVSANSKSTRYADNRSHYYYWLNSEETRMIFLDGFDGNVEVIEVRNYISPFFADVVKKSEGE